MDGGRGRLNEEEKDGWEEGEWRVVKRGVSGEW